MRRAPTSHGRRDRRGGFALIEAIAVLLLSGLVMLTLLIAMDLVTRNSRAATQRANAVEGLATGLAALRRDIAGASFTRAGEGPEAAVLFEGGPRTLSLARSGEGSGAQPGGLVRIESRYEQGLGLLVRTEAPLGLQGGGFAGAAFGNPVVLLTGPWTYRLSYGTAAAGEMTWRENWTNAKALPEVVRLEILDGASGQTVLTPLLAPLKVDAEIRCVPDGSGGCGEAEDSPDDEGQDDDGGGPSDDSLDDGSDDGSGDGFGNR